MGKQVKVALGYLRALRGRLSQREIAEATGISQKTLSSLESGNTKGIDFNTLVNLCDYLKCSPNDLLVIEEEPDETPLSKNVLKDADKLIAKALTRAMDAPLETPEQVWARFDALRTRMAASALSEKVNARKSRHRA
jgi:putative transcriptional regulator